MACKAAILVACLCLNRLSCADRRVVSRSQRISCCYSVLCFDVPRASKDHKLAHFSWISKILQTKCAVARQFERHANHLVGVRIFDRAQRVELTAELNARPRRTGTGLDVDVCGYVIEEPKPVRM